MGQAKARKSEIAVLKAQTPSLNILAIRHLKNGQSEFCSFTVQNPSTSLTRDQLLNQICVNEWLHNPPVNEIAAYLMKTDAYQSIKRMINAFGYVINFYELDTANSPAYSCREIMAARNKEDWNILLNLNYQMLTAANDIDVRRYA